MQIHRLDASENNRLNINESNRSLSHIKQCVLVKEYGEERELESYWKDIRVASFVCNTVPNNVRCSLSLPSLIEEIFVSFC